MPSPRSRVSREHQAVPVPIWLELFAGVEMFCLRFSPIYWGYGVAPGDGSAVIVVPGFLMTDLYLAELRGWLRRVGYRPYASGIGWNAECPNLLIRQRLTQTVEKARKATGRRVHLIGHSLGGVLARAIASQMPEAIASVTTLGAPFQGVHAHSTILHLSELVREGIHERHGKQVLPECYTARCTCDFISSMEREFPPCVRQTAVFTRSDGIVDWRVCVTGDPAIDCEVSATHIGLVFSPLVYELIGRRLAASQEPAIRKRQCA